MVLRLRNSEVSQVNFLGLSLKVTVHIPISYHLHLYFQFRFFLSFQVLSQEDHAAEEKRRKLEEEAQSGQHLYAELTGPTRTKMNSRGIGLCKDRQGCKYFT